MKTFPQIQIRQQYAQIGFRAEHARLYLQQPKAKMNYVRDPGTMDFRYRPGELEIDQSKAWDALGVGGILLAMNRLYKQARQAALEGIASIAQRGDRLAAIHKGGDAIVENATIASRQKLYPFEYAGDASYDNVDIRYTPMPAQTIIVAGKMHTIMEKQDLVIHAERGAFRAWMERYASVEIIPPQIDVRV